MRILKPPSRQLKSLGNFERIPHYRLVNQSVQWLNHVRLLVTPWTAAPQASLSITNSRSLPKLMSIELVMPSNHLILCHPLLLFLLPSIFPNISVFSNESVLHIRWPKHWRSFSFRTDWLHELATPQLRDDTTLPVVIMPAISFIPLQCWWCLCQ